MSYYKKQAYYLASKMRVFRAKTEEMNTGYSADQDRREIVRQIDWSAFNEVISQLEFCYKQDLKYKNKIE